MITCPYIYIYKHIFAYTCHTFEAIHVGKYTSPMEHLGCLCVQQPIVQRINESNKQLLWHFRQMKSGWWLNQPIWKICSSNWIVSPNRGNNKKNVKPPPSIWGLRIRFLRKIGPTSYPLLEPTASLPPEIKPLAPKRKDHLPTIHFQGAGWFQGETSTFRWIAPLKT